jgi:hypothetical protein
VCPGGVGLGRCRDAARAAFEVVKLIPQAGSAKVQSDLDMDADGFRRHVNVMDSVIHEQREPTAPMA